jgi:ribosomal protein L37E
MSTSSGVKEEVKPPGPVGIDGDEGMPSDECGDDARAVPGTDPTSMWGVGPSTAAAIESAPFGTEDIAAREVSFQMLVDAGINPGVAARLRRWYSLVWTYNWSFGADLQRRSEQLRHLSDGEREWIAASVPEEPPERPTTDRWGDPSCPRCGEQLVTYAFDGRRTRACEACGYAGVDVDHRSTPATEHESWEEARRRFRSRRRTAQRAE